MLPLFLLTFSLTTSPTVFSSSAASAALVISPVAGGPGRHRALPADSVGRVVQGGRTYVKHKVAKGDSFYAIARKYHVSMEQIVAANPKVKNSLSIGQVVLVPRSVAVLAAPDKSDKADKADRAEKPAPAPAARPEAAPRATTAAAGARTHVVTSGQTLSAIARKYHVSIADLRRWNNLKNDNLHLKQRLVVSTVIRTATGAATSGSPTVPVVAPAPVPKPETAPRDEVKQVTEAKKDDAAREERREEARAETHSDTPRRPATDAPDDTTAGTEVAESLRKVTESGMAETIEASGESTKFLALHRTAAVGSLLQVKNPQNGQSVYVRVIGKLPPTGANENVIIRLSRRAVQKLQVVDARFRVEVSYMP